MRATDGLQTTINLGPVHRDDQALSLQLSLGMSLPVPSQDEHLPDQIEAFVHQAGLQIQRRLFRALIEKADQELVLQNRRGKAGAGIQRRGTRPFTFKTTFGEVTVQRSRISHKHDDTIEVPSARAWETSHQLHITRNLRDAVCDQFSDRSAGESRAEVCRNAGDEDLLVAARSSTSCIRRASNWSCATWSEAGGPGRSVRGPVGLARPRCCRPRRPDRVSR